MSKSLEEKYELPKAEDRFKKYKYFDPYPNIPSALLNSADILAYVKKTGIISPFYEEDLKGASYEVSIKGKVIYYVKKENSSKKLLESSSDFESKEINLLKENDYFDLEPNHIAFVTLEPIFRIPYYMILRFNLKIKHIYKGLLLGTGPMVDPGFQGKLSIPLHNFTSNKYRFYYNDKLISMEFTKMSPFNFEDKKDIKPGHDEKYIEKDFPNISNLSNNVVNCDDVNNPINNSVKKYIAHALKDDRLSHIVSSIPNAIAEAKNDAKLAKEASEKIKGDADLITKVNILAAIAIFISCIGTFIALVINTNSRFDNLKNDYSNLNIQYEKIFIEQSEKIKELEDQISKLKESMQ